MKHKSMSTDIRPKKKAIERAKGHFKSMDMEKRRHLMGRRSTLETIQKHDENHG